MGLLDSLNPINLVKNAAESMVDSVLPDGLKSLGNDLVDVALDVVGGNYGGLANDVSSFLHDAETAMGSLTNLGTSLPSPATEPDAPPASTPASDTKSSASTKSSATKTSEPSSDTKSASTKSTTTTSTTTPASTAKTDSTKTGETAPTTTPVVTQGSGSSTAPDKTTSTTDDKSTSKSTSTSTSTSSSTTKSTASSDSKDITKFFAQSDTDLMAAVRDGKLPDAVKNDPASMQRLQLRMNEISEMNQLISQMLAAMHDMNKAVIQNIRA